MNDPHHAFVARVHARLGQTDYLVDIQAGHHRVQADEAPHEGGANAGPNPFALVLSGLAACTAITLRMYAQRKGWPLQAIDVEAQASREGEAMRIERRVAWEGELDDEQTKRLLEICEKTPVTRALKAGAQITTRLRTAGAA